MNKLLTFLTARTSPLSSPSSPKEDYFVLDFERCVYPNFEVGARAPVIPPVLVYQKVSGKTRSVWMTPRSSIKSSGPVCDCC